MDGLEQDSVESADTLTEGLLYDGRLQQILTCAYWWLVVYEQNMIDDIVENSFAIADTGLVWSSASAANCTTNIRIAEFPSDEDVQTTGVSVGIAGFWVNRESA